MGVRLGVTVAAVLTAVGLLAGVGTAQPAVIAPPPAGQAAGSLLGTVAPSEVPGCAITVRACVDLGTEQAWLLDKGHIIRGPVAIRQGDEERPTPRGMFAVQWKANPYTSREFLVQMPFAVFFAAGGVAFHQGDTDYPSAGCVKLDEVDARAFFDFLQVGDGVQVF